MANETPRNNDTTVPVPAGETFSVKIALQPVENSDQPKFSNFTAVQAGSGVVFLDFGFLEPQVLHQLAQLGQSGGRAPEVITGKLATRIALSPDAAANLAQQLSQMLRRPGADMN